MRDLLHKKHVHGFVSKRGGFIAVRMLSHFNFFASLNACLYSTGVGRALRTMFQVEGRAPLMVVISGMNEAGYAGSIASEKFSGATHRW